MALADVIGVPESFIKPFASEEHDSEMVVNNINNPVNLALPPLANPLSSKADFLRDEHGREIKINYAHGTTTLGFVYKNGIVFAVDSRATGGQYIGSQVMNKLIYINKFLVGTMAGGAADCVYWDRVLAKECKLYELRNKHRISTAAASKLMSNMAFSYKGMGLSMGMMIAGCDKNGASLFYVDSEGHRTKGTVFSVGSGSVYAFGVLDSALKHDLEDEEAYELARRAIYHATFRDSYSGGIVRVCHVKPTGWEMISEEDCLTLHDKYNPGT